MAVEEPWALDAQSFGRVCVDWGIDRLSVFQFVFLVLHVNGRLLSNYGTSSMRDARPKPGGAIGTQHQIMSLGTASAMLSVVVSASTVQGLWPAPVGVEHIGT